MFLTRTSVRSLVAVLLVAALTPVLSADVTVIPQDDPNNYKNWVPYCRPENVEAMNLMVNNLTMRIKALAENSADLAENAGADENLANGLMATGEALADVAAYNGCSPVGIGAAIASGMVNLSAAYAQLYANSANSQIQANAEESKKLGGYLAGWAKLLEACCNQEAVKETYKVLDEGSPKTELIRRHQDRNFYFETVSASDMKRYLGSLSADDLQATCDAARSGELDRIVSAGNLRTLLSLVTEDGRLK